MPKYPLERSICSIREKRRLMKKTSTARARLVRMATMLRSFHLSKDGEPTPDPTIEQLLREERGVDSTDTLKTRPDGLGRYATD